MKDYLPLLMSGMIFLALYRREVCKREGKPFLKFGKATKKKPQKPIARVSSPQKSQQKYSQRSDNSPNITRYKNKNSLIKPSKANYQKAQPPHVLRKLTAITGNLAISQQLVSNLQNEYPGRTMDWYVGQAIYRLQRKKRSMLQDNQISDRPSTTQQSLEVSNYKQTPAKYKQRSDNMPKQHHYKNPPSTAPSVQQPIKKAITVSVRGDLMRRLNSLTRNQDVSQRLVRQLCQKHPDKTADWCVERAISDIERDRR